MTRLFLYFSTMILPFEHYLADQDSPELYQAFNATPFDSPQETNLMDPSDADSEKYYAPFQFGISDEQFYCEMDAMSQDFETIAQHLGCSPDDVWQMWQEDELEWEAPIALQA